MKDPHLRPKECVCVCVCFNLPEMALGLSFDLFKCHRWAEKKKMKRGDQGRGGSYCSHVGKREREVKRL